MTIPSGVLNCVACGGIPELQHSKLTGQYSIHCTTCTRCTLDYPILSAATLAWNTLNSSSVIERVTTTSIAVSKAKLEPYCAHWMCSPNGDWFCSNCKRHALWDNDRTVDPELPFGFTIVKSPYCPHCGMSMAKSKGDEPNE